MSSRTRAAHDRPVTLGQNGQVDACAQVLSKSHLSLDPATRG